MNERRKKSKTAYLILVLLIFLVVAIIGGLAAVLFNMTSSLPVTAPPSTTLLKTNVIEKITPVSETYIVVKPEKIEKPKETRPTKMATVVPMICAGYGPQIKQRAAYDHPVTYSAQVQPNHVQFTLYPTKEPNAKGSQ